MDINEQLAERRADRARFAIMAGIVAGFILALLIWR